MALDQAGRVANPADAEHRAIGPYIHDTGEEWPFVMARTPYRPADFNDWRDGIHKGLAASAGVLGSFHTPDNN